MAVVSAGTIQAIPNHYADLPVRFQEELPNPSSSWTKYFGKQSSF
jgi:hypothetical protein